MFSTRHVSIVTVLLVIAGGTLAGCSSGASGTITVWYPPSLATPMRQLVQQAASDGITVHPREIGSTQAIDEATTGAGAPDVIVADSTSVDAELDRPTAKARVAWYVTFGSAPLVLAYDARSKWAAQLRSGPWYQVVTMPGFHLGRVGPSSDAEAAMTNETIDQIAVQDHVPSLLAALSTSTNVVADGSLAHRIQTGKVDAGFLFANEAKAAGLPTIPLGPPASSRTAGDPASASFTVTVPTTSANQPAADAFVIDLLSHSGQGVFANDGLSVDRPPIEGGDVGKIPPSVTQHLVAK